MVGLHTPVYYSNNKWGLAKNIKAGDELMSSSGKPAIVKNVEFITSLSVSIKMEAFPFPVIFGLNTPIYTYNSRNYQINYNMWGTSLACDLRCLANIYPRAYTKLGNRVLEHPYSCGYICGLNTQEHISNTDVEARAQTHIQNVPEELFSQFTDPNFRFTVNQDNFHRGYADALKDVFTDINPGESSVLRTMEICHAYALGNYTLRWGTPLTSEGHFTMTSTNTSIEVSPVGEKPLVFIETEGGFVAAGFRIYSES
jgi:hypothetical protein